MNFRDAYCCAYRNQFQCDPSAVIAGAEKCWNTVLLNKIFMEYVIETLKITIFCQDQDWVINLKKPKTQATPPPKKKGKQKKELHS